jgi:type II secretory pathway predicted ATPase ExeA
MYLEHFGISEPPFRITPVTVFFFAGANRGEILDALIYSICEVEGIVKVSGEVGSGKTMLCRMLLEKLPSHIEAIYLANPSLSREEMMYAIADGLGLNTSGERVGIIMNMIQNKLEEKAAEGKRVVVLVDEAHAMPLDTLEELRLLYNLQVGDAKLLQIVLFGQPELNTKLDQPNMRQLKDRIVHHFHMQPLSSNILESYLMFRMRTAGYRGPDIFSPGAVKLIAEASQGLMRRVNILADKSLLAAFVEDTYYIKPQHVQAAMRDSDMEAAPSESKNKKMLVGVGVAVACLSLVGWWVLDQSAETPVQHFQQESKPTPIVKANEPTEVALSASAVIASAGISPEQKPLAASSVADTQSTVGSSAPTKTESATKPDKVPAPLNKRETVAKPVAATAVSDAITKNDTTSEEPKSSTALFDSRMAATTQMIEQKTAVASIQLYYNKTIDAERIEGFLRRARGLGVLDEIYLLPTMFGKTEGIRVLYGAYPSVEAAQQATESLPQRYKNAFATSIHIF